MIQRYVSKFSGPLMDRIDVPVFEHTTTLFLNTSVLGEHSLKLKST